MAAKVAANPTKALWAWRIRTHAKPIGVIFLHRRLERYLDGAEESEAMICGCLLVVVGCVRSLASELLLASDFRDTVCLPRLETSCVFRPEI